MNKIKIMAFRVGMAPTIEYIGSDLESMQQFVDGPIEYAAVADDRFNYIPGLSYVLNENGKLIGLEPNINVGYDVIVGNCFITSTNFDGESQSVDQIDIDAIEELFKLRFIDNTKEVTNG
jgi:hypothetical protein